MKTRERQRNTSARIPPWAAILLFIVLSPLPFLIGLQNDAVLDDAVVAWSHPAVRGLPSESIWKSPYAWGEADSPWRPVATATLAWNFDAGGANRRIYFITQVALRVIAGLLLFWLLWRLLRNAPAAFFWSLLATVHAAASEGVLRLAGRGELLGAVFVLGAVLAHTWHWGAKKEPRTESVATGPVVWICYALALLSFAQAWILPFILLAGEWIHGRGHGRKVTRPLLTSIAPMVLLLVLWIVLRQSLGSDWGGEIVHGTLPWMGSLHKLLDSVGLLGTYARMSIFPLGLSTSYAHVLSPGGLMKLPHLIAGVAVAAILFLAIRHARRRGMTLVAFGLMWWVLGLIPCLPLLRKWGVFASEMYLLLPLMGLVLALGALTSSRIPGRRNAGVVILGVVCLLFGLRTAIRATDFRTDDTLLAASLRAQPKNADFLYRKGNAYLRDERSIEAQAQFLEATAQLEIDPRMWINLGVTFHQDQAYSLAVRSFFKAVDLIERRTFEPTLAYRAYYHMGLSLVTQGNFKDGTDLLEKALKLRPKSLPAMVNLAQAYARDSETAPRALELFDRAIQLEPDPKRVEELESAAQDVRDVLNRKEEPGHEGHRH